MVSDKKERVKFKFFSLNFMTKISHRAILFLAYQFEKLFFAQVSNRYINPSQHIQRHTEAAIHVRT